MTALNAIRYEDAVVILTDGAGYDRDGIIREIGPKCWTIEGPNIALATSGIRGVGTSLLDLVPRSFRDIDHIAAEGEAWFLRWHAAFARRFDAPGQDRMSVLMAGWSEAEARARMVHFGATRDGIRFNREASVLQQPLTGGEMITHQTFAPWRDGIALLEAQRRYVKPGEEGEACVVGGNVLLTVVQRSGISHKVIKVWFEDRVGAPIGASPEPAVSRADRRRLAKAGRRAA